MRSCLPGLLAAVLLAGLCLPANAQVNNPAYAGYFLVGRFGEVCTMCEVMVLCQADAELPAENAVPDYGNFTLYHIHTRTFWSQVTTIWEWFIANFSSQRLASGHSRPVATYTVAEGVWAAPLVGELHISLDPPLLAMSDGTEIERIDRRWRQISPATELGHCQRLPLWDALAVIQAHGSGGTR